MILTVVSFILVLGVLVFFHELGHYWVARRNGIVVEEFGMGYPPRLVKLFRYDGTDFTLNLIPFGGFARMKGEDMGDMTPGSFNAAGRGARAATLVAGPLMNALLAVVLFAASFMAGFPAVVGYPQVTTIQPGSAAEAAGLQPNDVILALNGEPLLVSALEGFEYNVVREASAGVPGSGLTVLRGGEVVELSLSDAPEEGELLAGLDYVPVLTTEVTMVVEDTPASQAGLAPGDLIYAVDDITISEHNPLNEVILQHAG